MLNHEPVLQAIGGLGPVELIIILVIVLLIFGAGKLPAIGGALGKSIRNFKKAASGNEEVEDVTPKALESKAEKAESVEVETQVEETKA